MTHVIIGAGVIGGTLAAGIADRTGYRFGRCDEGHRRASDDVAKMVGKMLLRRIERSRRYTVDSPRIRILCAHLLLREKTSSRCWPARRSGQGVVVGSDKRSRLPDALDALLRVPALTPKALAARLKVAPQTGTALLRALQGRGVVREVTGRGSFRAFAI